MIDFGKKLQSCDQKCFEKGSASHSAIQGAALDLGYCIRSSLARTWAPVNLGFKDECPYPLPQTQWWRRFWIWGS
jgi:hypothetical protein